VPQRAAQLDGAASSLCHSIIMDGEASGFQALMGDTDALLAAGWRLSSCQAFFFFPGTDSIETLVVFDR
jgi:hypothetical protein